MHRHKFSKERCVVSDDHGYRITALAPFANFRGLEIPWEDEEALEAETDGIAKLSRSRRVVRLQAGQYGSPVELFIKRYNHKTWLKKLLRSVRITRAREEFELGWGLADAGINTPRPVWLAEQKGRLAGSSIIATEAMPSAETAVERWIRCRSELTRAELLDALGAFTAAMHHARFYHDDYKAAHLLILEHRASDPADIWVIDLLGGRLGKPLTQMQRARNLFQLMRSFFPPRRNLGFTAEHRKLLLKSYCGSNAEGAQWSALVDQIAHRKRQPLSSRAPLSEHPVGEPTA